MSFNVPDNEHTHAIEGEEVYCPDCGATTTEVTHAGTTWLSCDNCTRIIFEGDDYE